MRYLFLLLISFISYTVTAQKPYAWINMQYNANYNGEIDDFFELVEMEGSVQQIETYLYTAQQDSSSLESTTKYNRLGQLIYYETYSVNEIDHGYYFDKEGVIIHRGKEIEYDTNYFAFEYNATGDSAKATSHWWTSIIFPDSGFYSVAESDLRQDEGYDLVYDSTGKVIEYWFDSVPVYTTFDEFGRKVCDSVIGTGHGMEHVHEYTYSKNTVIKKETNPWNPQQTKYEVDAQGNWINQYYLNKSLEWVLRFKREIKYFE
ncbi:MAG: hypothetical protein GQ574_00705 [Crocinitomix sp.]|nr:hypothetical protein [Crocinitomix sp.]